MVLILDFHSLGLQPWCRIRRGGTFRMRSYPRQSSVDSPAVTPITEETVDGPASIIQGGSENESGPARARQDEDAAPERDEEEEVCIVFHAGIEKRKKGGPIWGRIASIATNRLVCLFVCLFADHPAG
jgi:hypothetical protein